MADDVNHKSICGEAVDFMRESDDYFAHDRQLGLDDLRFSLGDQWPAQMQNARKLEERPWFVVNETDSYVRQVVNQMRQQRPRCKAHGVNSASDAKVAEVITGVLRHIQELSDADTAYDTAGEFAARMGWGYWRLVGDYARDDSIEQDIFIRPIHNPFSVSFDPFSDAPDGSDQTRGLISDQIRKDLFKQQYPEADEANFSQRAIGDSTGDWMNKESIRIAEFYRIDREHVKLIHLSDGTAWWEDEIPDDGSLSAAKISVKGDRMSWRKSVHWHKCTAVQVLEHRVLPGRYIPIVPVYGATVVVNGRKTHYGMVRQMKDPQRMLNFWETNVTEVVALAPKAKWVVPAAAVDDNPRDWEMANVRAYPVLKYKHVDEEGNPIPPPVRIAPEMPPQGALANVQMAHDTLQRVAGMFDPAIRQQGPVSGKAIQAEQMQSDMSQYHLYDNLTRSIKHTGRIILDWLPSYYGKKRVMRIIGADGKPDLITINDAQAVGKVVNDLTVGIYDVVMETGPGYNSKRQEAVEAMAPLLQGPNNPLMQVAGDLFFRNMDFPGAELIADRLAAANPLAQIDDKSDIPPRAQILIKQLQDQLQKAGGQIQQMGLVLKNRSDIEMGKEAAASHRESIVQAHETERARLKAHTELLRELIEDKTWQHDIAMREQGKLGAEEIKGIVALLLAGKETRLRELEMAANREEAEVNRQAKANGAANAQ